MLEEGIVVEVLSWSDEFIVPRQETSAVAGGQKSSAVADGEENSAVAGETATGASNWGWECIAVMHHFWVVRRICKDKFQSGKRTDQKRPVFVSIAFSSNYKTLS